MSVQAPSNSDGRLEALDIQARLHEQGPPGGYVEQEPAALFVATGRVDRPRQLARDGGPRRR